MKKKIYKIGAAALILGTILISSISAESIDISSERREIPGIIPEKKDLLDSKYSEYTIDYFEYCSISGKYLTKTSSDEYQVIAESDTKSIIVSGWAVVLDFGDIPQSRFCKVKTDSIKVETFIGVCKDGNINGKGIRYVKVGDYEPANIRSKEKIDIKDTTQEVKSKANPQGLFDKRYFIFGSGTCEFIDTRDAIEKEGKITGDLIFKNKDAINLNHPLISYKLLFIFDLKTFKFYSAENLPETIYITNFFGNGIIYHYQFGMRPHWDEYKLRGFASDVSI